MLANKMRRQLSASFLAPGNFVPSQAAHCEVFPGTVTEEFSQAMKYFSRHWDNRVFPGNVVFSQAL